MAPAPYIQKSGKAGRWGGRCAGLSGPLGVSYAGAWGGVTGGGGAVLVILGLDGLKMGWV